MQAILNKALQFFGKLIFKMDRIELMAKVRELTVQVEQMSVDKASTLEKEQIAKSVLYQWCREQMMAIHQLKYQFSKEVALIHRESVRLNQELRCKLNQLRGEPAVSVLEESPGVDSTLLSCCMPADPEGQAR